MSVHIYIGSDCGPAAAESTDLQQSKANERTLAAVAGQSVCRG
jgi:hypothetical protein